jgi:hypothetical protein
MRTFLLAAAASAAFATGALAQSYVDRGSGVTVPVDVYGQSRQAPTMISRQCGVDYAITDPDPNVRLELLRNCNNGVEGGAD